MSKNKIIIVLLIMLSICVISLYTTYAYEGNEVINEGPLSSTNNLIYTLKEIFDNSDKISAVSVDHCENEIKET